VGLFDFLKRKKASDGDDKPVDRKLASLAKTASSKKGQTYDRDEAMRGLIAIGSPEAAAALLKRFSLQVDPSITDQEEKQFAFDGIISIGRGECGKRVGDAGKSAKEISDEPLTADEKAELRDAVVAAVRAYCKRAENLTWALKIMRTLLDDVAYETQLLSLLGDWDTEYTRNVEPKLSIIAALEELISPPVRVAVEEYLDDVNETVRFHAVETTFKQGNTVSIAPLVAMAKNDESVRIKNKVAEGLFRNGWTIPEELRGDFQQALQATQEYSMSSDGEVKKP
jgi:HEAT repeat protein